eukprot:scaffold2418_cov58-Cyclotella_meneghiniana.AAC.15
MAYSPRSMKILAYPMFCALGLAMATALLMHWFSRARILCTFGRPMRGHRRPNLLATSDYTNCWAATWTWAGGAAIFDGGRYDMGERRAERAEGDVPIGDGCGSGCAPYRGSALSPRSGVLAKWKGQCWLPTGGQCHCHWSFSKGSHNNSVVIYLLH